MSCYKAKAFNPNTERYELAEFIDDHYGPHKYGVKFADGGMWKEEEVNKHEKLNGYEPGPISLPTPQTSEQKYIQLLEWLYTKEHKFGSAGDWKRALLEEIKKII